MLLFQQLTPLFLIFHIEKLFTCFRIHLKKKYWGAEFGNYTPTPQIKYVDFILLDESIDEHESEYIVKPLVDSGTYKKVFEREMV